MGAAFCFALGLILTQYGLRTVPSWRSPLYTIGGSMVLAWAAALGLGSIAVVAPLVALFPLMAVVLSYLFLRDERLHALGCWEFLSAWAA